MSKRNDKDNFDYLINEALGSYVYALRDPATKCIFYVGKAGGRDAKGNRRALDHFDEAARCAADLSLKRSLKVKTILEIQERGQAVEWFIIRRQLRDEEESFHVEAAVIDVLNLSSNGTLLNEQSGHGRDTNGSLNPSQVFLLGSRDIDLTDVPRLILGQNIMLFNIAKALPQCGDDAYQATRRAWRLGKDAKSADLAIGLAQGVSRGAWQIKGWHKDLEYVNKWEFDGTPVDEDLRIFLEPANYYKIIAHEAVRGYWQRGNPITVQFVGNGGFRVVRGSRQSQDIIFYLE